MKGIYNIDGLVRGAVVGFKNFLDRLWIYLSTFFITYTINHYYCPIIHKNS